MIATIDIGNTNIVIGIMDENGQVLSEGRVLSNRDKTSVEFSDEFKALLEREGIQSDDIEGSIISSVVPTLTEVVREGTKQYTGRLPLVVGKETKTGLSIETEHPSRVGKDMIVDAVAAIKTYKGPLMIFDLGTATTCSVVDENHVYQGHLIIPGVGISLQALCEKAAQLPKIELSQPKNLVGKNTVESMQSGVLYGNAAMIDGLIDRIEEKYKKKMTVLATGGIAGLIVPLCKHDIVYEPNLLLKGLWYIYKENRQ